MEGEGADDVELGTGKGRGGEKRIERGRTREGVTAGRRGRTKRKIRER
jgi:hypothetical protein